MKLSQNDIDEIASTIRSHVDPQRIVLFGSYADGSATDGSDLDLMVVMESDEPRYRRSIPIRKLFWPPKAPMDILVFTPAEVDRWDGVPNHIVTEVLSKGKVLYVA
jgi:predicted nucleotidyltransferase